MKDWIERIELPGETTDGSVSYEQTCVELPERLAEARVLDASCVDGFWSVEALKRGASSVVAIPAEGFFSVADSGAIQLSRWENFEWCRSRLQVEEGRMQLLQQQAYALSPEVHGTFDWVLMTVNANRLRHVLLALDAMRGVCKGRLLLSMRILTDVDREASRMIVEEGPSWLPNQTALIELLRFSGFELEGITVYPAGGERSVAVVIAKPFDSDT